jgi:hypothetical protein
MMELGTAGSLASAVFDSAFGIRRSEATGMKTINLIPAPRLQARHRRLQLLRCAAGCVAYAGALGVATVICQAVLEKSDPQVQNRLTAVGLTIDHTTRSIASTRSELDAAMSTLRASRSIAEQPDWSGLLAILASKAGDDIVLKGCLVRPREPERPAAAPDPKKPGPKPAPAPPSEPVMIVALSGLGKSQQAISRFALRLEETRLFGRVMLLDTNRETGDRADAIGFRIECSLEDPGVGAPRPADGGPSRVAAVPAGGSPAPSAKPVGTAAADIDPLDGLGSSSHGPRGAPPG